MKKLYTLLLAIAALFMTTNANAAVPKVGDQMYWQHHSRDYGVHQHFFLD